MALLLMLLNYLLFNYIIYYSIIFILYFDNEQLYLIIIKINTKIFFRTFEMY